MHGNSTGTAPKREHWELREDSPLWIIAYGGVILGANVGMVYLYNAWQASGDTSPFEHGRPVVAAIIIGGASLLSMGVTQLLGWTLDKGRTRR